MSTFLQLNTEFPEGFGSGTSQNETAEHGSSHSETPNLQSQVTELTDSISDEALRIAVGKVLNDLVFLLDYLRLIAGDPREPGSSKEVLAILNTVRGEAQALIAFIENHAMQLEGLGKPLNEMLDSTAYAIKHEVRRIFEFELADVKFDQPTQETRGALLHARGVLTNCFQQCMINLARVFDDSLIGSHLFEDWQTRRERSLILCRDLAKLIELVQVCQKESLDSLPEELTSFRDGSMKFLMYKDWQEYETLSDRVILSIRNGAKPSKLLHHLGCYLETLLAHVKARAVLADLALEPVLQLQND